MSFKAFFIAAAIVLATAAVGLPLVNLVVDPFQVFGSPSIPGINQERLVAAGRARLSKPLTVCRMRPDLVITGTSRAEFLFDPDHPALKAVSRRPYNLAMAGTGMHETRRLVEHAHNAAGTRAAIVTLDFHSFNAYREAIIYKSIVIDYDESNLVLDGSKSCRGIFTHKAGMLLFSGTALRESLSTIRKQGRPENIIYLPNGRRDVAIMERHSLRKEVPQRGSFVFQTQGYLDHIWFPKPDVRFCFEGESGSVIAEFRELVAFGRRKGMKLTFVLTPEHAMMQLAIRQAGLWPLYERWRSELVQVLGADAAQNAKAELFPLWDFATLNPITAEALPPPGVPATQQHMRWWYEATHSQPEVGAQMLGRMFGAPDSMTLVDGFGTQLDSTNIAAHLRRLSADIEAYAAAHRDEVAEVASLWNGLPARRPVAEYCSATEVAGGPAARPLVGLEPVREDPVAAARHQSRADELRQRGDRRAALAAYDQAIRVSPPNTALHFLRGTLRLELQDPAGALRDFDIGLRLDPVNATLMALREQARAGAGHGRQAPQRTPVAERAGDHRRTLADAYPADRWPKRTVPESAAELAASLQRQADAKRAEGDRAGAIADYGEAIRVGPPNTALHYLRGTARLEAGDKPGAAEDFVAGLRLEPRNAALKHLLAQARAAPPAKAAPVPPPRPAPDAAAAARLQSEADARRARGDLAGAIAGYGEAIRVGPPNTALHYLRGTARLEVGDKAGAAEDFEAGLRLEPGNAALLHLLGQARAQLLQPSPGQAR